MKFILKVHIIMYSKSISMPKCNDTFLLEKMIFISIRYYVTLQMNLLDLDENLGILSGRLSFSSHNILPHHQLIC